MTKKSNTTNNTNTNNIFSELLERASKVSKQARERASEVSENAKNGYATLTKQASKQARGGFVYVMHNANILPNEVINMLECNASERARIDWNKVHEFIFLLSEQELDACKIAISKSLAQEREQAQKASK